MGKSVTGRKEWEISQAVFEQLRSLLNPVAFETDQTKFEAPAQRKEQWQLSKDAFAKLLARFGTDDDLAGREYERMRKTLVFYFERRRCIDPEKMADETFDRVCRQLDKGEVIGKLTNYCYSVARNLWREYLKGPESKLEELDEAAFD